jgi:hypothetical protein
VEQRSDESAEAEVRDLDAKLLPPLAAKSAECFDRGLRPTGWVGRSPSGSGAVSPLRAGTLFLSRLGSRPFSSKVSGSESESGG